MARQSYFWHAFVKKRQLEHSLSCSARKAESNGVFQRPFRQSGQKSSGSQRAARLTWAVTQHLIKVSKGTTEQLLLKEQRPFSVRMPLKLEICVDSLESAINAEQGGADRIELCSSLCLGGLTPTIGLLKLVKKHLRIPVVCMLRSRHDHFVYSESEMAVMVEDLLALKAAGADGFVFGALTENGDVHEGNCATIIRHAAPLPVTFHRAFDCSPPSKWKENLRNIITLGFARLLTSGLSPTASQGLEIIRRVIKETAGRVAIMIGSGVDERNLLDLMRTIGAEPIEFHGSASVARTDVTPGRHAVFESPYPLKVTSMEKVLRMRAILNEGEHAIKEAYEQEPK